MQYSFATVLALASTVLAQSSGLAPGYTNGTVYTTAVVTQYVTYCPLATTITTNGATYTATAGQTLTITNCPCTITTAVATLPYTAPVVATTTTKPAASTPVVFTGAANAVKPGMALIALGALVLL